MMRPTPPIIPESSDDNGYAGAAQDVEPDPIWRREEEHRLRQDLVDLLTEAVRTSRGLLARLTGGTLAPARHRDLGEVMTAELSRTVAVERRFLVGLVREVISDREADRVLAELERLEELTRCLYELLVNDGPADPRLPTRYAELAELLASRDEAQQRDLFPRLRHACDRDTLRELARRARAARHSAPTRPHPHAPLRPLWRTVTDPVIGAADRIRDEVTGRPTDPLDVH